MQNSKNRFLIVLEDLVYIAVLVMIGLLCFRLFGWMLVNFEGHYRTDIPAYISILSDRPDSKTRLIYVLFRNLMKLTDSELGINIFLAAEIVLICLSNHYYLRYYSKCDCSSAAYRFAVHILSIAAVFFGPIYLKGVHEVFFKDTFPTFAWHSPTQQMMTLFSIIATFSLFHMMDNYKDGIKIGWWISSAFFFFLSAYSKPSYLLDIAPAIVIVFLIDLAVKNGLSLGLKFRRLFVMGLSLLPAGIYLIVFYLSSYSKNSDTGIVMELSNANSAEGPNLLVALGCSMLFPLIVTLFNLKKIAFDRRYLLSVLIAVMGLVQWGMFSESGWRSSHGNFTWGCIIGGYIFMLTSMAVALNNVSDKNYLANAKPIKYFYYVLLLVSLAAHVASNLYYFYGLYNGAGFWR